MLFGQGAIDASFAVVNRFDRITLRFQVLSDQLAKSDVVVNYQNSFHWLLRQIERHMNYLRQVVRMLQQPSIFVRKEVSISN